jgi:hypothetical protein
VSSVGLGAYGVFSPDDLKQGGINPSLSYGILNSMFDYALDEKNSHGTDANKSLALGLLQSGRFFRFSSANRQKYFCTNMSKI